LQWYFANRAIASNRDQRSRGDREGARIALSKMLDSRDGRGPKTDVGNCGGDDRLKVFGTIGIQTVAGILRFSYLAPILIYPIPRALR